MIIPAGNRKPAFAIDGASGHGMGTALSEKIAQQSDVFAFLFEQLVMKAEAGR